MSSRPHGLAAATDRSPSHAQFTESLNSVRGALGAELPAWLADKAYRSGELLESRNPARPDELLASFHRTPISQLDHVVRVAHEAQRRWRSTAWAERASVLQRAAELLCERSLEFAARVTLEVGKCWQESLEEVREAASLLRHSAGQPEQAEGPVPSATGLTDDERRRGVLRPYGVFAIITPFSFPIALAARLSAPALLGGNVVILKPSAKAPWSTEALRQALVDAGLPAGVLHVVNGGGTTLGSALVRHPAVDGVSFAGSMSAGRDIQRHMSAGRVRPCSLELGGKNPAIICRDADLELAIEDCLHSAFGFSGQSGSALSRLYVHESILNDFVDGLARKTWSARVGDPSQPFVFTGPVISGAAVERFEVAMDEARMDGAVITGGNRLRLEGALAEGYFVAPTLVALPHVHRLMREELLLPFVGITSFRTLDDALRMANDCEHGLTATLFSNNPDEVERFMAHAEARVLHANPHGRRRGQ